MPSREIDRRTISDQLMPDSVRSAVRTMLLSVPAFRRLEPAEQRKTTEDTVKVASYLTKPESLMLHTPVEPGGGLAVPGARKQEARQEQGGQRADEFPALLDQVDFPEFVGSLIQSVFQAIVDASIEQMRAYGELLADVANTVDDFERDNISDTNTRERRQLLASMVMRGINRIVVDHGQTKAELVLDPPFRRRRS